MAGYILRDGEKSVVLRADQIDRLLGRGDGDAALLYLCLLRNDGAIEPQRLMQSLRFSELRLRAAETALQELGLIDRPVRPQPQEPAQEPVAYTTEEVRRALEEDGYSVVYDTASHIFSLLEDAKFRRGDEDDEETRRLDQCDLLIIDDLGTEMNSTFVQSALYQLINGRLLGMKSTIISTNLTPEDIGRRYSQQVYSRIEGEYTILPFIGTDIRQLKRQRGEK